MCSLTTGVEREWTDASVCGAGRVLELADVVEDLGVPAHRRPLPPTPPALTGGDFWIYLVLTQETTPIHTHGRRHRRPLFPASTLVVHFAP